MIIIGTGTSCKVNFQTGFVVAGSGFFPIGTINILSLKSRKDSDFKNNFVIMKERDKHI